MGGGDRGKDRSAEELFIFKVKGPPFPTFFRRNSEGGE